jgi:nitrate/nitrite-specific signal transduction histidine kinase
MKIRYKLGITVMMLSLIIVVMFLATWYLTGKQKDDGLVINLAGRQRMLTQKMTKAFFHNELLKGREGRGSDELVKGIENTMAVFDRTLSALRDSGDAPLSLDLEKGDTGSAQGPGSRHTASW